MTEASYEWPAIEEWRPVVGREGFYEVSSLGRVKSLVGRRGPDFILTPCLRSGYPSVVLSLPVRRHERIHRLVARAFIGPPPSDEHQVCHWDDDRTNNVVSNLRWGTPSDNMHDRLRNGIHHLAKRTSCARDHPFDGSGGAADGGRRTCLVCAKRRANESKARLRAQAEQDPSVIPHGTTYGYGTFRCRCELCQDARRAYAARRKAARI